ncbi:helix-turn-helix transcriptional regulator [Methylobacterium aquaticum]|nr:helix-turn-helix transcriptional regulator [Methylobacterium aquaticum]
MRPARPRPRSCRRNGRARAAPAPAMAAKLPVTVALRFRNPAALAKCSRPARPPAGGSLLREPGIRSRGRRSSWGIRPMDACMRTQGNASCAAMHSRGEVRRPRMSRVGYVPYLNPAVAQRWRAWDRFALGRSGATVVEAEMTAWSGSVPGSLETVIHVLAPSHPPVEASRDIGDGRRTTLARPGEVCVTPARSPGDWAWGDLIRDVNLVIPHRLLARAADDAGLPDLPDLMPLAREPRHEPLIEGLVLHLAAIGRGTVAASAAEIDHAVGLVACWLLRQAVPREAAPRGGLRPAALGRVRAHVEENIDRDLSVGELADLVGLSIPYFSHAFRTSTGEAPYRYVLRRRCAHAQERLLGRETLTEIALSLGFASQSHFTTAFRQATGMTPAAWRRERMG